MPTHKGKRAGRREGEQKGERREEEKRGERRRNEREDCSLLGIITNIAIVRMSQRRREGKERE